MSTWAQLVYARTSWQDTVTNLATWNAVIANPGEPVLISFDATPNPETGSVFLEAFAPFRFNWVTITRTADGVTETIRDGTRLPLSSGGWLGFDYEAPLGVDITYTATFTRTGDPETVILTTDVLQLDAPGYGRGWLMNAVDPAGAVIPWVEGVDDIERPAEVGEFSIVGRALPVVVTGTQGSRHGALRIFTRTLDDRDALLALLDDGDILLLRTTREFGIGNLYMAVTKATEGRVTRMGMHPARRWTLEFIETYPPVGVLMSSRDNTWQQVINGAADWTYVKANRADWLAVYTQPFVVGP